MNKIKQTACGVLLAVALVGCSQQPVGIIAPAGQDVAVVSQEKEVKEEKSFSTQGWKEKAVGVGISFVAEKVGGFAKDYAIAIYGAYDAKKKLKDAQLEFKKKCASGVKYPKNCPK